MKKSILFSLVAFIPGWLMAQRPFGHEGAIHKDSNIFVAWASQTTVKRSYQSLEDVALGYTTVGDELSAAGKAGENGVVSLGDGGEVILQFDKPVKNGPGADFAVFENGIPVIGDTTFFLELAFVEVSSDGNKYVRFPARSFTPTNKQILNGEGNSPNFVVNLAGKYSVNWGTPFDLEDIRDSGGINLQFITHIKIKDVVGSLNPLYASYDVSGNKINDPFPTPFASGGFDLDAVGVIHVQLQASLAETAESSAHLYTNIVSRAESIRFIDLPLGGQIELSDSKGNIVWNETIDHTNMTIQAAGFVPGVYFCNFRGANSTKSYKLVIY